MNPACDNSVHTSSGVQPPFDDRRVGPPVRLPHRKKTQVCQGRVSNDLEI